MRSLEKVFLPKAENASFFAEQKKMRRCIFATRVPSFDGKESITSYQIIGRNKNP